jgi:hypothetical protein
MVGRECVRSSLYFPKEMCFISNVIVKKLLASSERFAGKESCLLS